MTNTKSETTEVEACGNCYYYRAQNNACCKNPPNVFFGGFNSEGKPVVVCSRPQPGLKELDWCGEYVISNYKFKPKH